MYYWFPRRFFKSNLKLNLPYKNSSVFKIKASEYIQMTIDSDLPLSHQTLGDELADLTCDSVHLFLFCLLCSQALASPGKRLFFPFALFVFLQRAPNSGFL